jgi:hypothetical protein
MNPVRLALLFVALNVVSPAGGSLRVLRVTPATPASPSSVVTVTFDRPVAGGLDATVDPRALFSITPSVPGTVEWRDPVTLRFTPASPLTPGASYRIRISPDFQAMDGSKLAGAYEATFRVAPPRVLAGEPASPHREARYLPATPIFALLVSAPVDRALVERMVSIRMDACGTGGGAVSGARPGQTIPVRITAERELTDADPNYFTYMGYDGPYPRDPARDLRRVVELEPATPLPLDCAGVLVLPPEFDVGIRERVEWRLRTYEPLRVISVGCGFGGTCPTGPVRISFSTPVRGAEVLRRVRLAPEAPFTVSDTTGEQATWTLDARLAPRRHYAVVVDGSLTDIFGQRLGSTSVRAFTSTGYSPNVSYEYGKLLVEREGLRTLAVQHVNVDTLEVTVAAVPDSLIQSFLGRGWGWDEPWQALVRTGAATRRLIPVRHGTDERLVTGVPLGGAGAGVSGPAGAPTVPLGTLLAVTISSPQLDSMARRHRPIALVQVTDLALHARVGTDQALAWVTGVHDGLPRAGVVVTLYDAERRVRATARTDREGIARMDRLATFPGECRDWSCESFEGYMVATLGGDRAVVGINAYDPDLSPWRFNVAGAWGTEREPVAAAVFTERGIYRPGESVHAKAIVREGPLGALRAPAPGDSLRWVFNDREGGVLREWTVPLSEFGTAAQRLEFPQGLPLGQYQVQVQTRRRIDPNDGARARRADDPRLAGQPARADDWRTLASAHYQVAEYRPPEFLVDVATDPAPRFAGDTADAYLSARYLFGAPMAHAPVRWVARQQPLHPWELRIPGAEGYQIGKGYSWWDDDGGYDGVRVTAEGADTLDAAGRLDLRLPLPAPSGGRAARVSILASVTDANRQTVAGGSSLVVHPASFYIGAKVRGSDYFWTAGRPVSVEVIALPAAGEDSAGGVGAPGGAGAAGQPGAATVTPARHLPGIDVRGTLVRREWHRVRRNRGGYVQEVGSWVQDTVATCAVRTAREPVACDFTPTPGGS